MNRINSESTKRVAGTRQRKNRNEGSSVNVSARALIIRLPMERSAAQCGINPQCMSLHSLPPRCRIMTGMLGEVSGATLKRGVYVGRSRSRFQRTCMSLNSNLAVNRPHMITKIKRCLGGGSTAKTQALAEQPRTKVAFGITIEIA